MQTIYARIDEAGAVVQWPLLPVHIANLALPDHLVEPVAPQPKPAHDRRTQGVAERPPVRDAASGRLVQRWQVYARPTETIRAEMQADLATLRWRRETGGTVLADGTTVPTGREDQSMVHGAYQALQAGLIDATDFKTPSGWVREATLAQIAPIAQAVAAHVDRCFRAERQVAEQIDAAEDAEALAAIDLADAFDAAYAALANSEPV
ncbi:uncharacterized protein DUF4376 [Rhodothalassium salexigens DSM 2132]|uniref:Uncharacterized protein DUF4376 n=1 Tax=Rhodothalassium salexigens DSM 2132 TaxID=1188247 RepID=A0A4R2P5H8_RHOSA|nr:DUF4376 domain-containing protein [Rhodothalassium salexigens]MBB4212766.1 hypothetical protein [Rhodothalassium salexigens DSM 2132]MBK1638969.1 hypothetical protein [Rhodothalassium salexigens DSM 2132]TCP30042.1 uncharacterized protein DUF4376 [Rhodothalassium salexigens DSM 2132]